MSKENRISLKELEIVFENCDSVIIPGDYLTNFYLGNISRCIRMFSSKDIDSYQLVDDVYICIDLRIKDRSFLTEYNDSAWNRLVKGKDITQLHLIYSDESKEMFFVNWNKDSEFNNSYQSITFDKLSLIISINRQNGKEFNKRDYLLKQINSYKEDLSEDIIKNANDLINQLEIFYLPDEIYLPDKNSGFLRLNWFEDNFDVFMIDVYPEEVEVKLYLSNNESEEIEKYICRFYSDKLNLNDILEKYICYKNKILDYFEFKKTDCLN